MSLRNWAMKNEKVKFQSVPNQITYYSDLVRFGTITALVTFVSGGVLIDLKLWLPVKQSDQIFRLLAAAEVWTLGSDILNALFLNAFNWLKQRYQRQSGKARSVWFYFLEEPSCKVVVEYWCKNYWKSWFYLCKPWKEEINLFLPGRDLRLFKYLTTAPIRKKTKWCWSIWVWKTKSIGCYKCFPLRFFGEFESPWVSTMNREKREAWSVVCNPSSIRWSWSWKRGK